MSDAPCPANIKNLITRFDRAAQDFAFKGSAHPDDWEVIEHRYLIARESLERAIAKAVWRQP